MTPHEDYIPAKAYLGDLGDLEPPDPEDVEPPTPADLETAKGIIRRLAEELYAAKAELARRARWAAREARDQP
jgi:hypothetical protein